VRRYQTAVLVTVTLLLISLAPSLPVRAQSGIVLAPGFHATIDASGLYHPTALDVGPDGRLYVAEASGTILSLGTGGTRAVASGFATPLGLAWHAHKLYISSTGEVSTLTPSRGYASFTRRVIISGLPTGRHQNDGMAFRDGWMYLGVGSTCNACVETDPRSATIMRFHLDGTHGQRFARGLRNPYGLAFRPGTGQLYATDNGRDDLGNQVPDELNHIVRGGRYGWPNCWGRGGGACKGTIAPVALFEPHSSADGLAFYTGHTFPARYRGDAFVAEFGQTVCCGSNGHKLKVVHFSGSRVTVSDFATGLTNPLAVTMARDGALLLADYGTGIIWRIQANGH
jgi:glucose/arabinose dehydrogenase